MSRDITLLTPYMIRKHGELHKKADAAGLSFITTRTGSEPIEQMALYAQGREPLDRTNHLRKVAGLGPITAKANRHCVTWTLLSEHLINTEDLDFHNDHSKAFDLALKSKIIGVHWEIKVDVNKNDIPDYTELGELGESIGLVWGGRFRDRRGRLRPDMPHFQQPEGITGFEDEA